MLQVHAGRDETGAAGHFEHLLEVQGLALVDEVQHAVGVQLLVAVAHGGEVGGGVEVAAAGLLHDHRQRVAFGVPEFFEEHAHGAVALDQHALGGEVGDHVGQVVVVGALALHVGHGQLHAETVVDLLAMRQGNFVETGPQAHALGVVGLQLDHQFAGAVGEFRGLVEALLRRAVEDFQVMQFGLGVHRLLFQVGQQHAELGAPVADVVLADHAVAEEFEDAGHGVADDGRAQVADVHFLGQVRRGQVDHHALRRAVLAHAEMVVGEGGVEAVGQPGFVLEEVEEAGAGDFHLGHLRVRGQRRLQLAGQVSRLLCGRLGEHQGDVAGVVAMHSILGGFHLDVGREAGGQGAVLGQAGEGLLDQLADGVFHLVSPSSRRVGGRPVVWLRTAHYGCPWGTAASWKLKATSSGRTAP
ncbi:hypothetical protein D9M68_592230 [compost metagenome]